MDPIKVVFVCLGNICRSPMAEAVFTQLVDEAGLAERFEISSAGTGSWHVGEPAHPGTRSILAEHGISYTGRAQQLAPADVAGEKTWVIVMDGSNEQDVRRRFGDLPRLHKLLTFAGDYPQVDDVPDPYYTGGFSYVYELVENGSRGLLAEIRRDEGI